MAPWTTPGGSDRSATLTYRPTGVNSGNRGMSGRRGQCRNTVPAALWSCLAPPPSQPLPCVLGLQWSVPTMCWLAWWDLPLRLQPPLHIPSQSMCFKQRGNGTVPPLIHAHTHAHIPAVQWPVQAGVGVQMKTLPPHSVQALCSRVDLLGAARGFSWKNTQMNPEGW